MQSTNTMENARVLKLYIFGGHHRCAVAVGLQIDR